MGLRNGYYLKTMLNTKKMVICAFLLIIFFPVYIFCEDRLLIKNDSGEIKFVVTDQGKVAIGLETPETDLDIIAPNDGIMRLANNATDYNTKFGRMTVRHYSNSEEPLYIFGAASTDTSNFIAFGGGATAGNAATQIDFFTAPNTTTPVGTSRIKIMGNGYVGFGRFPDYPLHMASGARCTTGGTWTNASSREYKENIRNLTIEEAENALHKLAPVKFNYKEEVDEEYVGFIAEDVPELVATKDRKAMSSMDVVAVLTKVIQEQQKKINELNNKLTILEDRIGK